MATYTTDWRIITPQLGWQPITEVSTEQKHDLGTEVQAKDFGSNANGVATFKYVKGVASAAAGSWVVFYEDDFSTSLLTANDKGQVGVCMAAIIANTFGWVQTTGKAVAKALTGYVDNALVYATSTAGSVDDAVVSGDRVKKALGASAVDGPATGMAEFEIDRPFMDDGSAA